MIIETPRLKLLPCGEDVLRGLADDPAAPLPFPDIAGSEDWINEDLLEAFPFYVDIMMKRPATDAALFWVVVERESAIVVGSIGLKGWPDAAGSVEIGYGICPARRKRGYASEAAQALLGRLFERGDVVTITAECEAANTGSIKVLEKAGMRRIGEKDGLILWRIDKTEFGSN
jgi:[ribosomal protein S5]-alanine N-acetyltransferase